MQTEIKKVKFKAGLPLEIEVLPIAETISKYNGITKPHRADFYHIFWIQKGTATYLIDFKRIEITCDSFLFINKNRVKAIDNSSRHDGKLLLFTKDFFARSESDTKYLRSSILFSHPLEIPLIVVRQSLSLQTTFNTIDSELTQDNDAYHYHLLHNLLHNLLLLAERERRKQGFKEIAKGADLDYTVLFRDLLEAQFKTLKSVNGFASQMSISEKRLTNATSKTMGESPKSIIDERVMLEAKRLLIHTNLSIKEIGYHLGFQEPTNFIKYFRKHTEKTPIKFRESLFNR